MYTANTKADPKNAPKYWATIQIGTFAHGIFPHTANANDTAGLRCPPLIPPETITPKVTPSPQPKFTERNPVPLSVCDVITNWATEPHPNI